MAVTESFGVTFSSVGTWSGKDLTGVSHWSLVHLLEQQLTLHVNKETPTFTAGKEEIFRGRDRENSFSVTLSSVCTGEW